MYGYPNGPAIRTSLPANATSTLSFTRCLVWVKVCNWYTFVCSLFNEFSKTNGNLFPGIWESIADTAILLGVWKSAKVMHNLLLHNILRVPLSFMDTTPIGRILSRFSKDVDVLDNTFTYILCDMMRCFGDVRMSCGRSRNPLAQLLTPFILCKIRRCCPPC